MKRSRVGVVIEDEHVAVAAIRKGGRPEYFRLRADDELPERLAAQLDARRLGMPSVRLGLERNHVMVKAIDVPRTADGHRRSLVAFELDAAKGACAAHDRDHHAGGAEEHQGVAVGSRIDGRSHMSSRTECA